MEQEAPQTSKGGMLPADTGLLLTQAAEVAKGKYMVVHSNRGPDAFLLKFMQLRFNLGHFS